MHPADKDTIIGKRVTGGAQARNINIGKRAKNRPAGRVLPRPGSDSRGSIGFLMARPIIRGRNRNDLFSYIYPPYLSRQRLRHSALSLAFETQTVPDSTAAVFFCLPTHHPQGRK